MLEAESGPLLEDFPEEAPDCLDQPQAVMPLVCPVSFAPDKNEMTAEERLAADFEEEYQQMKTWYEIALQKKRQSTAGVSGLSPDEAKDFIITFIRDPKTAGAAADPAAFADQLRLAADEVKTVYFEAVTAQPGQPTDSLSLAEWFWGTTSAAQVINKMRLICQKEGATPMQLLGNLLLVPRSQLPKFENSSTTPTVTDEKK